MTFKCVNCNKEKDESELGAINLFLRIGFAIFVPLGKSHVCRKCVTQVTFAGSIGAILFCMLVVGMIMKVFL